MNEIYEQNMQDCDWIGGHGSHTAAKTAIQLQPVIIFSSIWLLLSIYLPKLKYYSSNDTKSFEIPFRRDGIIIFIMKCMK